MFLKISIITPTYNQGDFIEKSILSVLNQNYPNLEYIIIDGGSTDNTIEILKKYSNNISYWISEPDLGQSDAINKGTKIATGDIINWLNSDDYLVTNALHYINSSFKLNKINVLAGNSKLISISNSTNTEVLFKTFINSNNILSTITNTSFNQPGTFFKREVFQLLMPVETDFYYNMDLLLWLKYLAVYGLNNIKITDEVLAEVTQHAEAKTIKGFKHTAFEKNKIYTAFFNALKNKNKFYGMSICSISLNSLTYLKLKVYYYRYRLFKRNLRNEIIAINNFNILKCIGFTFLLILVWLYHKIFKLK